MSDRIHTVLEGEGDAIRAMSPRSHHGRNVQPQPELGSLRRVREGME